MKRIIILALLCVVLISQVVYSAGSSSLSVNGAIGKIIGEFTADDKLFYIYNEADEGAFLSVYFGLFSKNRQRYNLYSSEGNFIKSVNENIPKNELSKRNVVIFGGPCANKYWGEFSDETCENWPYKPGQSVVKVVDNNGYLALLIAGTDKKDTFEIARLVLQHEINNDLNQGSTYLHNSESKRVANFDKCKQDTRDFTCLMFYYHAESIYRKNGNNYAIILKNINDVDNVITFTLNDIPYSLELGESVVNNNVEITPNKILYSPITSKPRSVEFHFSESMEGFKPFTVLDGAPTCSEIQMGERILHLGERTLIYFTNENIPYDITFKNSNNGKADILLDGKSYPGISEGAVIDNVRGRPVRIGDFDEPLESTNVQSVTLCFEDVKPICTLYTNWLVPMDLGSKYNTEIDSEEKCEDVFNANKLELDNNICGRLLDEPIKKIFLRWDFKAIKKYNLDCSNLN